MPFITLPTPLIYPSRHGLEVSGAPAIQNTTLNALNEACGNVIRIPHTGLITRIGFRTGTVTTADDLSVSIQTVNPVTGLPTGLNYGGSAPGIRTVLDTDDNVWAWTTLATPAQATEGDMVALLATIVFVNGSLSVSRSLSNGGASLFPYLVENVSGAFLISVNTTQFAIEYSDGSRPYIGGMPALDIQQRTPANGEVIGNRLTVPFRCRCIGIVANIARFTTVGLTYTANLYDGDDALLASSGALPNDQLLNNAIISTRLLFSTPVYLDPATTYRAVLVADAGASLGLQIYEILLDSAETMEAWPAGPEWYKTARGVGAWTDTQSSRMMLGLVLDQINTVPVPASSDDCQTLWDMAS